MPILNRASEMFPEVAAWRRHMHRNPELGFDLEVTEAFVAERLDSFGCDAVHRGIGGSGIVALVQGRLGPGPTIGLRADMDALPLAEETGLPYASTTPGRMHACGHDGHTAMLLGAARHLVETRAFAGTVALIFQPAEEIGQGARAMLADGLMERFGIERVYGMHNMPGMPAGDIAVSAGPVMAATAKFTITVTGRGGHAARPHMTIDPIAVGAELVTALQTISARNIDPVDSAVISITRFAAGSAFNIIPEEIAIWGTTRALDMEVAALAEERIRAVCGGLAAASGATIVLDYDQAHPVTENRPADAAFAARVAEAVVGPARVRHGVQPVLAGEDFSHMLAARPGAYVFIGNGDSAGLHHPLYDFDDEAIPAGVSFWVALAEAALPGRA